MSSKHSNSRESRSARPASASGALSGSAPDIGILRLPGNETGLVFDTSVYEPMLADDNIAEADKQELLAALWEIVVAFVDLGFSVHPAQLVGDDKTDSDLAINTDASAKAACEQIVNSPFENADPVLSSQTPPSSPQRQPEKEAAHE